jgi:hypothetical protein
MQLVKVIGARTPILGEGRPAIPEFRSPMRQCAWVLLALFAGFLGLAPALQAQTTATITGTVSDATGSVVPAAKVILRNEATNEKRETVSNKDGNFAFPALLPGSYSLQIQATGFKTFAQNGISLNAAEERKLSGLSLSVGKAEETVTVQESTQIIPTDSGARAAVLDAKDIQNLALGSRDLSELLKVLPGVTTAPNGISNGPSFNFTSVSVGQSSVGNGLNANGVPNRGGTSQLSDGVDIDDPGCDCNSIAIVNPDMTQEVSVQTSNFGADAPFGPVVINTISKSGTANYHGEGYLYARNDVLNANDWQSNHAGNPKGSAHYYYPGGNGGGPIPFTHKKLLIWGGFERILQNTGNSNRLESFIPTPDMMAGNFTTTAANNTFCTGLNVATSGNNPATRTDGCNDLTGTVLPDGTTAGPGTANGSNIPAQFLDGGAKVLSSFWPKANANPATTPGNYNYNQVIPGIHDGWLYRLRADYNFTDKTTAYISYQQGYDTQLSQGNGAHIYWTPGNSIPYPGGGLYSTSYTKAVAGHFVHTFTPTLTNEFIASWGYGNFPVGPSNPSAAFRSTLGYPGNYGTVFNSGSKLIPSYSSGGNFTFPDFSQADIFEPSGKYLVRKEMPAFADNVTKVWGTHTVKFGGYAENVGNIQGASESQNGSLNSFSFGGTLTPNVVTGKAVGSPNNPIANFLMGITTSYSENNASPVSDMAYQSLAFYFDDSWKATRRLTIEYGIRFDHIGHWYDRKQLGMAVFIPSLVNSDFATGKLNPGVYWHGINSGIPNSGQPDRFVYADPRFGVAYDIFGTGKTILRGGWGLYRFSDQYNDYTGALTTAQSILGYSLPGSHAAFLNQFGQIAAPTANQTTCCNGGVNALDPTDFSIPYTTSWNFTVSQQLPWNTLLEVAYVGNDSENLVMGGESISGSGFGDYTNQNKIPLGGFFKPDPKTGLVAANPEKVNSTCAGATCNQTADYRPYGNVYGDNSIDVINNSGYGNYHGMQLSWVKRSKNINFNANYTWSKTLGTGLQINPFAIRPNYGVESINRPQVINLSGSYTFERPYSGEHKVIAGAANGWTISNITTWQGGGNLQALNSPNFNMSLQYATINGAPIQGDPTKPNYNPLPNGAGTGLSQSTYYGTNAAIDILPTLTCNAKSGLSHNQLVKYSCFAPPAVGASGGQNFPYFNGAAYFDSDLALYKTFHIFESQSVQFRFSAFNWINHPLPQFSGSNQLSLHYNADYSSKAFTPSTSQYPNGDPNNFGVLDNKSGAPTQRILELALKYQF